MHSISFRSISPKSLWLALWCLLCWVSASCNYEGVADETVAGGRFFSSDSGEDCPATVEFSQPTGADHVAECSPLTFSTNPPSGGAHYGSWAAFARYEFPLSPGFVVHALEHGGVAFWYNCPEGCPEEVAAAQAVIDALPEDGACVRASASRRALLLPNPDLETRWAASSWGWVLTSPCLNLAEFEQFYLEHVGQGPEELCNDGVHLGDDPCR